MQYLLPICINIHNSRERIMLQRKHQIIRLVLSRQDGVSDENGSNEDSSNHFRKGDKTKSFREMDKKP